MIGRQSGQICLKAGRPSDAGLTAAIKDAGSYTVYWKVTTTNYGDKIGSFTIDVERATLELSRNVTATRAYNGTVNAAAQVTGEVLAGQQSGESINVSITSAEYDQANVGVSRITVTYAITAESGAKLSNYNVKVGSVEISDLAGTTGTVTETVTAAITPHPSPSLFITRLRCTMEISPMSPRSSMTTGRWLKARSTN